MDGHAYRPAKVKGFMTIHVNSGKCAPRTRPGKDFPGGKHLRRALRKLSLRQTGQQSGVRPDRVREPDNNPTPWGNYGFTRPGSMKA